MRLTRRRFLLAAAATAALGRVRPERWEWRGTVLGAEARIMLQGPRDRSEAALAEVTAEIEHLERIFSLHRRESQLSRLNRAGRLDAPSRDLRDTLAAAARWRDTTGGAFDIAVQPLWRHWAQGLGLADRALERVRSARITVKPGATILTPGTELTLNGIAQGTIADRVAAVLARRGFSAPVIDTGEMRLPGPDRRTVDLPEAGLRLRLAEVAVATSAPGALPLDARGTRHHLFDPRSGDSPSLWRSVSVIAPSAEAADALSTGFAVSDREHIADIVAGIPGVAVIATATAGETHILGAEKLVREART